MNYMRRQGRGGERNPEGQREGRGGKERRERNTQSALLFQGTSSTMEEKKTHQTCRAEANREGEREWRDLLKKKEEDRQKERERERERRENETEREKRGEAKAIYRILQNFFFFFPSVGFFWRFLISLTRSKKQVSLLTLALAEVSKKGTPHDSASLLPSSYDTVRSSSRSLLFPTSTLFVGRT